MFQGFVLFCLLIYLFLRETESTHEWGSGQTERDRENSQADFLLNVEPNKGLDSKTLKSGSKPK